MIYSYRYRNKAVHIDFYEHSSYKSLSFESTKKFTINFKLSIEGYISNINCNINICQIPHFFNDLIEKKEKKMLCLYVYKQMMRHHYFVNEKISYTSIQRVISYIIAKVEKYIVSDCVLTFDSSSTYSHNIIEYNYVASLIAFLECYINIHAYHDEIYQVEKTINLIDQNNIAIGSVFIEEKQHNQAKTKEPFRLTNTNLKILDGNYYYLTAQVNFIGELLNKYPPLSISRYICSLDYFQKLDPLHYLENETENIFRFSNFDVTDTNLQIDFISNIKANVLALTQCLPAVVTRVGLSRGFNVSQELSHS